MHGLPTLMTYHPDPKTMIVRMANKNDTLTPAPARAETPASKKSTNPAAANGAATAARAAVKKKKPVKAAAIKGVTFSTEDIALRAYFISEHRQRYGIEGNEHSDWIEAERQLMADHKKKTAKRLSSKKGAASRKTRPE